MTRLAAMEVGEWIERYRNAWEGADADAVVRLFTPTASYRPSIFRRAHVGRDAIAAYWRQATQSQSKVAVRMGRPFIDGRCAVVEWWTTMIENGEEVTLPGCLLLRFSADGRCHELREYWQRQPGRHEPPPDWGS
jgi:hypothetical protein